MEWPGRRGFAPSAGISAMATLVTALLQADCQGSHGFYVHDDHLRLAHLQGCQRAQEGMQVTHIEQTPLAAEAFAAYYKALAVCDERDAVTLGNNHSVVTLPCPADFPSLAGWWTLAGSVD